MKKQTILLSLCFLLALLMPTAVLADVAINTTNFPDNNFRTIVATYDTDGNGTLSSGEIGAVTYINCSSKSIRNLKGVECFTALKTLECTDNQLTALNVSQNTALTKLDCRQNQLTKLDVSQNTALTFLACGRNVLNELDVSKNTALTKLSCDVNNLNALDVSLNTALTTLDCGGNPLVSLDVKKNTALTYLDCSETHTLTELDVSKNTALTLLACGWNALNELDVSKNTALTRLYCQSNQLTNLDVSHNTVLEHLHCQTNELTLLNVSNNTELTYLDCVKNHLTSLDVSNNRKLKYLYVSQHYFENTYTISVDASRTFTLSTLPGNFDVSKASNWKGGTVSGNTLTVDTDATQVTYDYDCGNNHIVTFTLNVTPLYTITFDTDGGSDIAPITQEANTTVTAPADPTKTGYTFDGWNREIPATMPAENITIKAKWSANSYTITFDTDGGTSIPVITQAFGTPVTAPANPTKTGYTFDGWDSEIPATMPAENITIKAKWAKEILHTIEFQIETPESCKVELEPGASQTVKDGESFSFTLHILDGYVKASAFAVKANDVTLNPIQNSRRQMGETYRIENIHDSQVVTITGLKKVAYTVSVTGSYATLSGEGAYTAGETVSLDAGTLTGYDFEGWTVTAGNAKLKDAKQAKTTFVMPDNAVAVTANWKQQKSFVQPQTGDNSRVLLWGATLVGCVAALVCMKKKKK